MLLEKELISVKEMSFMPFRWLKKALLTILKIYLKRKLVKMQKENPFVLKRSVNVTIFQAMKKSDLVFGIGPAGTGKTYLAVVMAVNALKTWSG